MQALALSVLNFYGGGGHRAPMCRHRRQACSNEGLIQFYLGQHEQQQQQQQRTAAASSPAAGSPP